MTIPSQQYAGLSDDVYKDRAVGRRVPGQEEIVTIDGQRYAVLEHVNNKFNGYQGTIYRREGSGEIVVAHRGTEGAAKDILTDATMVTSRTNPQAADALALTKHALDYSEIAGKRTGHAPEVTVTGHSLGGALAQVSAHHYHLKGETFNSYGAASLSYRIPEGGGNSVVNHVMASDPVSAASPHFGQVRIYAKPDEIATLSGAGYSNSKANFLLPDYPLVAAGASLGAHELGNFLDKRSVLTDPNARPLAEQNKRMIDEYRRDVDGLRTGTTILTRSAPGLGQDAIDAVRGPLAPGQPAKRDAREHGNEHTFLRIDQPGHVGNALFQDAQRGVHAQDARVGRTPDQHSAQLSGALASEMHSVGGTRIDEVVMSPDASRTFAVQGRVDDPAQLRVSVETITAINTSLEQSSQRVAENVACQSAALEPQQSQPQQQQQGARVMC